MFWEDGIVKLPQKRQMVEQNRFIQPHMYYVQIFKNCSVFLNEFQRKFSFNAVCEALI